MGLEFDRPPDAARTLEALLERSGARFRREGERFSLLLAGGGCRWQTVCDCREDRILVYGIHPARVTDPGAALALCSALNARVVEGGFFLREEHIIFRTGARLLEHVDAAERAARALEYNAAAMVQFWQRLSNGAAGLTGI